MKQKFKIFSQIFVIAFLVQIVSGFYNDCFKDDENDNKIRIGFLSRYKSSKVGLGD